MVIRYREVVTIDTNPSTILEIFATLSSYCLPRSLKRTVKRVQENREKEDIPCLEIVLFIVSFQTRLVLEATMFYDPKTEWEATISYIRNVDPSRLRYAYICKSDTQVNLPNLRILKASGHYSLFFIRRPSLLSLLKLIPGSQKYIVQRRRIVFGDVRRGDSATIVDQFFSLYLSKWVWNSNRCCREIMNSKRLQVKSTSHPSTLSMTNLDLKESTTQWSL